VGSSHRRRASGRSGVGQCGRQAALGSSGSADRGLGWYQLARIFVSPESAFGGAQYAVRVERGVSLKTSDGVSWWRMFFRPKEWGELRRSWFPLTPPRRSGTRSRKHPRTSLGRNALHGRGAGNADATIGRIFYPFATERREGSRRLRLGKRQAWGMAARMWAAVFGYTQWVLSIISPRVICLDIQIASSDFHGISIGRSLSPRARSVGTKPWQERTSSERAGPCTGLQRLYR